MFTGTGQGANYGQSHDVAVAEGSCFHALEEHYAQRYKTTKFIGNVLGSLSYRRFRVCKAN